MWPLAVLLIMLALTGVYTTIDANQAVSVDRGLATSLAGSMATYRSSVIQYFALHPNRYGSVDLHAMTVAGVVPTWSTLYTQPQSVIWTNYRDTNGLIYVYAATQPAVNIASDIAALSQNSMLTGVFHTGDTVLNSPAFGATGIALPQASSVSIPNGSPLWIAVTSP